MLSISAVDVILCEFFVFGIAWNNCQSHKRLLLVYGLVLYHVQNKRLTVLVYINLWYARFEVISLLFCLMCYIYAKLMYVIFLVDLLINCLLHRPNSVLCLLLPYAMQLKSFLCNQFQNCVDIC